MTRKILLCCTFGLGIFVVRHSIPYPHGCCIMANSKQIACAIANRVYSFANIVSIQWIYWYVREASTAVIVSNIPNCYTLLRRILDVLRRKRTEIVGRARQPLPHPKVDGASHHTERVKPHKTNKFGSIGSSRGGNESVC
jgi:hypothetical protein